MEHNLGLTCDPIGGLVQSATPCVKAINAARMAISSLPSRVVITHGTDTMTESAKTLASIRNKTIVFTGVLSPPVSARVTPHST